MADNINNNINDTVIENNGNDAAARANTIKRWVDARKAAGELYDCVFSISPADFRNGLDCPVIDEVKALLDKYRVEYGPVDTVPGSYNLNRDWIQTGIVPAAVEYCGVYPADWDPEDIAALESMENEGRIIVSVDWKIDGKYVPNH